MNPILLYPFILVAGALQAAGNSMNARLRIGLVNPWLTAAVSFSLIVFVFVALFLVMPTPLPGLRTSKRCRSGRRSAASRARSPSSAGLSSSARSGPVPSTAFSSPRIS